MEPRRPRLHLIAALAAAAGLVAYLALVPASGGTVRVAPPPQPAPLAAPAGGPESLATKVPGFDGTLVAQLGLWGRIDAVQWPSQRAEPITFPLPQNISLSADAAGRLFAGVAPSALEGPGLALYVGTLAGLRPAAMDVLSVAFHSTAPGRLAWLEFHAGDSRLRTSTLDPGGALSVAPTPVAAVAADQRLVGWGDWGFLLAGWDEAAQTWVACLLDPSGRERWRQPAVAAHASPRGDVLLAHDEPGGEYRWSLTPAQPAGGRATPFPEVPADADLGAAWSPDGARIAFVAPGEAGLASRLHVLHLDGTPDRSAEVPLRVAGVSWSHDGRFLLARAAEPEGRDALFFFDTLDGSIGEIEFDRWVQLAVTRAGQR